MTKRPPIWQRKGFQSDAEYKAACAATRQTKKAALLSTKTQHTHRLILRIMWSKAEFEKPLVTITKEQIMGLAPCSLDTVRRALKELKSEGSIKPIRNHKGGRSIPTTWLLSVAGRNQSPADMQIEKMERDRDRDATWRFLKAKYGPMKALEILGDQDE